MSTKKIERGILSPLKKKALPLSMVDQDPILCACGRTYGFEEFRTFPYIEELLFKDPPERLEVRRCPCGTKKGLWTDEFGVAYGDGNEEEF